MISEKGDAIYYTLDGSDPSETGIRYTKPITLEENNKTYTVKAVCKNSKGIYSSVTQQVYTISIPAPDAPSVTPDGGNFTTATTVRIRVPDGCSAYYTWDGSTPTAGSRRYTGPITVPEGNHVLSVVLIDRETGLRSEVYRGNFIYNSQDYSTIEDTQDSEPSEAEDLISDINHTDDTDDEPGYVDGADEKTTKKEVHNTLPFLKKIRHGFSNLREIRFRPLPYVRCAQADKHPVPAKPAFHDPAGRIFQ